MVWVGCATYVTANSWPRTSGAADGQRGAPCAGPGGACSTHPGWVWLCVAIRRAGTVYVRDVPVILTAGHEDEAAGDAAGITAWLLKPFSVAYVRTRIRVWLLRVPCQWQPAPKAAFVRIYTA